MEQYIEGVQRPTQAGEILPPGIAEPSPLLFGIVQGILSVASSNCPTFELLMADCFGFDDFFAL
jgi:hypothetical protein